MRTEYVDTPVGRARLDWYAADRHRATLVLGHGSATGVEAADLQAIAHTASARGITVVLVTQPYRLERNPQTADPQSLDRAWTAAWKQVSAAAPPGPIVAGGRSAGSQVACRTSSDLGAVAVVVLAYPFLGPGSADELTSVALPTLVVQGGRDPFGTPADLPELPASMTLVEIPEADHLFLAAYPSASRQNIEAVAHTVTDWLEAIVYTAPQILRTATPDKPLAPR